MLMRPQGGVLFVAWALLEQVSHPDPPDDEHFLIDLDIAFGFRYQSSRIGLNPTRLQRATQGAGQSAGSGSDDVVEGGGVRLEGPRRRAIVRSDLVVNAKDHGLGFGR